MKISREEYLWQLRQHLHRLPEEECEAALEYYLNYFEEAGSENEQDVIRELGRPEDLAKTIIADVMDNSRQDTVSEPLTKREEIYNSQGKSQEPGWEKYRRQMECEEWEAVNSENQEYQRRPHRKKINGWMILCLILTFPVWGGLAIGLLAVILGLAVGVIGLIIGVIVSIIAIIVALIVGAVIGIVKAVVLVVTSPILAAFVICLAILMISLGVLLVNIFAGIIKRILPGLFKLIVNALNGFIRGIKGILRGILGNR